MHQEDVLAIVLLNITIGTTYVNVCKNLNITDEGRKTFIQRIMLDRRLASDGLPNFTLVRLRFF